LLVGDFASVAVYLAFINEYAQMGPAVWFNIVYTGLIAAARVLALVGRLS
jgi:hypothetical protein